MKKCYLGSFLLLIISLSCIQIAAYAAEDTATYNDAINYLKSGQEEFAFSRFNHIRSLYADSRYRDEALFRVAEYHFNNKGFIDAERFLKEHFGVYPNSLFRDKVAGYLVNIKTMQGDAYFSDDKWQEALKRYEEATSFYTKTLDINPNIVTLSKKNDKCKREIKIAKKQEEFERGRTDSIVIIQDDISQIGISEEKRIRQAQEIKNRITPYYKRVRLDTDDNGAAWNAASSSEKVRVAKLLARDMGESYEYWVTVMEVFYSSNPKALSFKIHDVAFMLLLQESDLFKQ